VSHFYTQSATQMLMHDLFGVANLLLIYAKHKINVTETHFARTASAPAHRARETAYLLCRKKPDFIRLDF